MIICAACPSETDCRIYGSCLNTVVIMAQQRVVGKPRIVDLMHVTNGASAPVVSPVSDWGTVAAIGRVLEAGKSKPAMLDCWHAFNDWGTCVHCGHVKNQPKTEIQSW